MPVARPVQIVISLALALSVTAVVRYFDVEARWKAAEESALRVARQVASQTDGLILVGMEKGEGDAVRWAAQVLTQGVEPRIFKVSKIQFEAGQAPLPGASNHRLDRGALQFEYTALARQSESTGFKVAMRLEPVGFLGTRSRLEGDLTTAVFFAVFSGLFFFLTQALARKDEEGGLFKIMKLADTFTTQARSGLMELGTGLRDSLRQAQALANAAGKSRVHVVSLRERVHKGLRGVQEMRAPSKELLVKGQHAETVALNLVIEATRVGEKGKGLGAMAEELYRHVQELRKFGASADELSAALEQDLQPMVTDADQAYTSFEDLPKTIIQINRNVNKSMEAMVAQAQLIQESRQQLLDPDGKKSA